MAKQEDLFKNVVSHAKSMDLFFRQAKYTMVLVYDYAQNGVELKKEHTRILVESDGSNER
jgi:glycyl-tRNA synthetase